VRRRAGLAAAGDRHVDALTGLAPGERLTGLLRADLVEVRLVALARVGTGQLAATAVVVGAAAGGVGAGLRRAAAVRVPTRATAAGSVLAGGAPPQAAASSTAGMRRSVHRVMGNPRTSESALGPLLSTRSADETRNRQFRYRVAVRSSGLSGPSWARRSAAAA